MSATIQQGLRPLFLMCFIMGLGVYPIKQSNRSRFHKWIVYLSILYFLAIWFVYGCVLFYILTIYSWKIFPTITAKIILIINTFTAMMSAILIFYYQKVRPILYFAVLFLCLCANHICYIHILHILYIIKIIVTFRFLQLCHFY